MKTKDISLPKYMPNTNPVNSIQEFSDQQKSQEQFNTEFEQELADIKSSPPKATISKGASAVIPSTGLIDSADLMDRWSSYLVLLKEWYFDLHKMVKGMIVIYGADDYISIGTNILFPSRILTNSKNFNSKDKFSENSYILAHVEAVRHIFTVGADASRQYQTTIDFTRGILIDATAEIKNYLDDDAYCMLDNVLETEPYDQTYDNVTNVNSVSVPGIQGENVAAIAEGFNSDDIEEDS